MRGLAEAVGAQWRVDTGHPQPVSLAGELPTGRTSPAVLLVKHQSTWETFAMAALMPHPLAYVFKERAALYVPFWLGDGQHGHDPLTARVGARPCQGGGAGRSGCWRRAPGSSCSPRARAFRVRKGQYKTRTRLAIKDECIPVAVTSAKCWPQSLHQNARHGEFFHRSPFRQGPPAR